MAQLAIRNILLAFFLISATFTFVLGNSKRDEDIIQDLPGLQFWPNFEHYSGYLRVSEEHALFYWLVTSQHDSATDPLIFWFNGGPGCSSLFGLLGEHGPYLVSPSGNKLVRNPSAWNRRASVVYIESPSFVGYSVPGNSPNATDATTAHENYEALKQFFAKFPEYRHHRVFIAGESYAGIYLPTLAEQIVDGQRSYRIDLQGMAIGNGYVNVSMNVDTRNRYYYGHGMVDEMEWQHVRREKCGGNMDTCDLSDIRFSLNYRHHYHFDPYDIYDVCGEDDDYDDGLHGEVRQLQSFIASQLLAVKSSSAPMDLPPSEKLKKAQPPLRSSSDSDFFCEIGHDIGTYLNRWDVRDALHVSPKANKRWFECSGHGHYKQIYFGVEAQVKKVLKAGIRVLLFYGDTDTVCNFLLGAKFAAKLGHGLKEPAKPWVYNGQLGGFKTIYEGGLTFITVRGSGHMVPQKKGAELLHIIEAFTDGKDF